ncbi:putative leucoanthocyanidin reductase [Diaporthe ampelina]|uniref:Putative leucoanthocyanidin reductase n=1 Tax=Diaporthe ampelina TaxID=1214573 RepID=A0A0G2HPY8_9PEZI|nr:putative leucoanthocyanidin reductase [Diaporthe ampelina]
MASIDNPILVTGGSGFVAMELISQLLVQGYAVHTTVRSLQNTAKVSCLQVLKAQHPEGRLLLFEADLLQPGSFHQAMQGCSVVFHLASPFKVPEKIKDGYSEMVQPALQGTRNVLKAVEDTPSVSRVVFTSTTGAIAGDYKDVIDKMRVMSHDYFNETSTVKHNPYHYSKVLAEKEAWRLFEEHQKSGQRRWDLVVICPAFVLGPTLTTSSESGSLFLMDELLSGLMFYGVPELSFLPVDVRDVAAAHIRAAELKEAYGRLEETLNDHYASWEKHKRKGKAKTT